MLLREECDSREEIRKKKYGKSTKRGIYKFSKRIKILSQYKSEKIKIGKDARQQLMIQE